MQVTFSLQWKIKHFCCRHTVLMHLHISQSKLKLSITGAYKQYVKCRPVPSSESVKRMKENDRLCVVGYHPLLVDGDTDLEEQRLAMLHSLRSLQPKGVGVHCDLQCTRFAVSWELPA